MNAPLTSPARVRELLGKHGLGPDRDFGQNFLIDANALAAVVNAAGLTGNESVLEFGPGLGVLTRELALRAKRVVAVEIDPRLLPALDETLAGLDNVTVLNQDALEFDYSLVPEGTSLVANLPYNVATPLVLRALQSGRVQVIVAMVQREVAERMVAEPGTAGFGAWSLILRHFAEARIVRNVSAACFYPEPEVTSSIVRIDSRPGARNEPGLFALIHDAFRHRRKTLRKNLVMAGYAPAATVAALSGLGLDQRVRAEELSLAQFRRLEAELAAPGETDRGDGV